MSEARKPLSEMTPAELFDEINADGSNYCEKAHRARMGGREALRRLQSVPAATPAPEPASALAERLLDLLPGADLPRAIELIEADRAAVREQALREAVGALQVHRDALGLLANQIDGYASRRRLLVENEQVGSMQRLLEKLLTKKRTP